MEDVSLEHAIVTSGNSHIGGLISAAYYRRSPLFPAISKSLISLILYPLVIA